MDAYELYESRFVQWATISGATESLWVESKPVPEGKIHTLIGAGYRPSDTETENVQFQIHRPGRVIPITQPVSFAYVAGSDLYLPLLTEGMELKLYPGEFLTANRDGHEAGTAMTLSIRYIESDLPYYAFEEPQKKVVKASLKRGSVYRSTGGISERTSPGPSAPLEGRGRGGRGSPEPI